MVHQRFDFPFQHQYLLNVTLPPLEFMFVHLSCADTAFRYS